MRSLLAKVFAVLAITAGVGAGFAAPASADQPATSKATVHATDWHW